MNCGSSNNRVGGSTPGEGNLISGNGNNGVVIGDPNTMGNVVVGNLIGTDVSGAVALPNGASGVYIADGASHNRIGGGTSGERNVISGNNQNGSGVLIRGAGTTYNVVIGNYLGLAASGASSLSNRHNGVSIEAGASYNTVGGSAAGHRNVISGNDLNGNGVRIADVGTMYNAVIGNYIGTNASGTTALPNFYHGVQIANGAEYNRIGGSTSGERNIISGNRFSGVTVGCPGASNNTISGNYIGTDATATLPIPNTEGVSLNCGSNHNVVGGSAQGEGNLVSGNSNNGVSIGDAGTNENTVSGNYIGLNASGSAPLGNQWTKWYQAQGVVDWPRRAEQRDWGRPAGSAERHQRQHKRGVAATCGDLQQYRHRQLHWHRCERRGRDTQLSQRRRHDGRPNIQPDRRLDHGREERHQR